MGKYLKYILVFIVMFTSVTVCKAANFTLSANQHLTKGGQTYLTIKGTDVTGRFNISTSNSSVVSISESSAWIENNSYSIVLTANNVGTATITVTPFDVSDSSGKSANLSARSFTVTVSLPREKSTDNYLKNLSVDGYEITPKFERNKDEYSVIVPEDTKTIKINAVKNESHETVSGAGLVEVTPGANKFSIVVTSETGVKRTYTLNVEVKDSNPINVTVNNQDFTLVKIASFLPELNYDKTTTTIDGIEIPGYLNKVINKTIIGLKDNEGNVGFYIYENGKYEKYTEINYEGTSFYPLETDKKLDGFEVSKVTLNGEEVNSYTLKNERFAIVYGVNLKNGEEGFYKFDTKTGSMILFDEEELALTKEQEEKVNLYSYIIIGFSVILVIMLILLITRTGKRGKKKRKEVFDENIEETLKLEKKEEETPVEEVKEENVIEETEETEEFAPILDEKPKKKKKKSKK